MSSSSLAAVSSTVAMVSPAVSRPAAASRFWKDVPVPILFVLGVIFGVCFATTVVSLSRPRATPAFAPVAVALEAAPVVAAPSRIESAPFVAWAAPPAMPTVSAEPQLPSSAVPAPVAHAKRSAHGSRRASR